MLSTGVLHDVQLRRWLNFQCLFKLACLIDVNAQTSYTRVLFPPT